MVVLYICVFMKESKLYIDFTLTEEKIVFLFLPRSPYPYQNHYSHNKRTFLFKFDVHIMKCYVVFILVRLLNFLKKIEGSLNRILHLAYTAYQIHLKKEFL